MTTVQKSNLQASANAPQPFGAIPNTAQLKWHDVELYGLVHFTPTTFENKEWGFGDADPKIFNPLLFDAEKIVLAAKEGGLKALILVAKHHDGFTLWPSKTTAYNISQSPFRNGNGDMVKEFADATRKHGLKFGVYCSPWDRNSRLYGGPEYLKIYQQQLTELYTNYGDLFMSWHDGANGGDGYYGGALEKRAIDNTTYYDWSNTWAITKKLQPNASIFSDVGPDVRWVGNEQGFAADTSWATFTPRPPIGLNVAVPGQLYYPESPKGTRLGAYWMPAECDVPLRQGWFYHPQEKPKSPQQLFDLYLKSVGRGAALDLGLAPDTRGLLADADIKSLKEFGAILRQTFSTNLASQATIKINSIRGANFNSDNLIDADKNTFWASADQHNTAQIELNFPHEITFDLINLQEFIALGQRVDSYKIEVEQHGKWETVASGASIGAKRLIHFNKPYTTKSVKINLKAPVAITIAEIGLHKVSL
ncbi:MAG: alpha-L-fucosidase [Pedobacter sp.]|nr:MAG: alpha-L-fucosidase [Pedobacter sp.]